MIKFYTVAPAYGVSLWDLLQHTILAPESIRRVLVGEGIFEMIRHLAELKMVNVRYSLENFVKEDHLEIQEK